MAIEIFWASGSPYAWRVLLTCEYKQVPYEGKLLSFQKQEHKTEAFRAMNPREKVPVLRDGAFSLHEFLAIMTYLERRFPEQPIFGRTAEEAGLIQRVISEYTHYVDHACEHFILPLYFGGAAEKAESIKEHAATLRTELTWLEHRLVAHPYVAGERVSASDFVWFPALKSIERAASKDAAQPFNFGFLPYVQTFPGLAAWIKRIEALPGYERTYPPHWR